MVCLEDWDILEREHTSSLAGAIGDLEANTLRLPLTGGTKVYGLPFRRVINENKSKTKKRLVI